MCVCVCVVGDVISSKAHFHGQNTVDNHINEVDHQNNGTCECVVGGGEEEGRKCELPALPTAGRYNDTNSEGISGTLRTAQNDGGYTQR